MLHLVEALASNPVWIGLCGGGLDYSTDYWYNAYTPN